MDSKFIRVLHLNLPSAPPKPQLPAKAAKLNRRRLKIWIKRRIAKILKAELMRFRGHKGTQEVRDAMAEISFRTLNKIAHTGNVRIEPHDAQ